MQLEHLNGKSLSDACGHGTDMLNKLVKRLKMRKSPGDRWRRLEPLGDRHIARRAMELPEARWNSLLLLMVMNGETHESAWYDWTRIPQRATFCSCIVGAVMHDTFKPEKVLLACQWWISQASLAWKVAQLLLHARALVLTHWYLNKFHRRFGTCKWYTARTD